MTAHRAFQFCKQYKRTTEFRRLCEIIRNHLANLNKYRDQRDRPDLTIPESLQLYLDTRVDQLKIATNLELWQVWVAISFDFMLSSLSNIFLFYHFLVNYTGSISFSRGYSWFNELGEKESKTFVDGYILCQVNRNILGCRELPLPCLCMA